MQKGGAFVLRPRIKQVHQPLALPGGRILIGGTQFGVAQEIQDDEDGAVERVLVLMDGTRSVEQMCTEFGETHPHVDEECVREVVQALTDSGFVEDAGADPPANLSAREVARYAPPRHFFSWIDTTARSSPYDIQSAIKSARVTVLGVGGTGSAVASGLVVGGIGALHVADFDRVEESNLTRQLLYSEAEIGKPKVTSAVARLRAMNSNVEVTGSEVRADGAESIVALMEGCDVFVLCADEPLPDLMRWVDQAARRTRTPWFMSLYTGPMTVVGSFVPGETACWNCLYKAEMQREHHAEGRPLSQGGRPNAVNAAGANISGQLCALDIQYHLAGLPVQTRGRVFHWNLARWDHSYAVEATPAPDCPACTAVPR
ncbi:TOMM precursor leader peptide-binding protein [Streptomyces sp. WMMB303]|uniref:TOMM precursor leader peptide-binding protein n=1 Tax=Streptomyces sp. WMMB303 TaxID=3034154 RepID=UPI0023EE2396|nr:TOMM precursor leader peptide-binding protein [Streptomyces sp. WMMB303]MDF4253660.1 TOMM precursor leader peptide-binding protein [Streptomyces sp. WMMB303]